MIVWLGCVFANPPQAPLDNYMLPCPPQPSHTPATTSFAGRRKAQSSSLVFNIAASTMVLLVSCGPKKYVAAWSANGNGSFLERARTLPTRQLYHDCSTFYFLAGRRRAQCHDTAHSLQEQRFCLHNLPSHKTLTLSSRISEVSVCGGRVYMVHQKS